MAGSSTCRYWAGLHAEVQYLPPQLSQGIHYVSVAGSAGASQPLEKERCACHRSGSRQDPASPPFVKAGDHVTPDTVVCIIEAMKVFNEIKAGVTGTIRRVMAGNESAVEYGQPLFMVKPD